MCQLSYLLGARGQGRAVEHKINVMAQASRLPLSILVIKLGCQLDKSRPMAIGLPSNLPDVTGSRQPNSNMRRPRGRVSIPKEDRIWSLRCQGYDYESIARITNVSASTPGKVIQRVRRRPPYEVDPIRRGRGRGFLSDLQIHEIRLRHARGETLFNISKDFEMHETAIGRICRHQSYVNRCEDESYERYGYSFANRLRIAA